VKIDRVVTRPLFVPYRKPFHWAHGIIEGAEVVLVEVESDSGITGLGESIGGPSGTALKLLIDQAAELMIGRDPAEHRVIWQEAMTALFRAGGVGSAPRFGAQVLAGLEVAQWDLLGKAAGQPVYKLLGGAQRGFVSYHGFAMGDTPEAVAAEAAELAAEGFEVIYIKAGFGAARDLATVAAVRAAIGPDKRLRIDANEAWSVLETRHMAGRLAPYGLEFIEQPTRADSLRALEAAHSGSAVPIAADQAVFSPEDAEEVCRRGAADLIVIGPHETGGLARLADVARIAAGAGLSICLHGLYETGITTAASHQLGVATPNLDDGNQHMQRFLEFDLVKSPDLAPRAGRLEALNGPGLGIELDADAVAEAEAQFLKHRGK
jgi:muconate cycloisomerase